VIVVSDTSPLAYLVEIGVAECLPHLFGSVVVPPTVIAELNHPSCPAAAWVRQLPEWVHVVAPQNIPMGLDLDRGEREAIAVAIEIGAERLLIDELRGRETAKLLGLKVAGTLAIVVAGAERGLFDGIAALDRLELTNFYAADELLETIRTKVAAQRHPPT